MGWWRNMRTRARALRRRGLAHCKQAGPANAGPQWPPPWGPHCYLPGYNRHPAPFNKTAAGRQRRCARLVKQQQRAALLHNRDYDDGYYPLSN